MSEPVLVGGWAARVGGQRSFRRRLTVRVEKLFSRDENPGSGSDQALVRVTRLEPAAGSAGGQRWSAGGWFIVSSQDWQGAGFGGMLGLRNQPAETLVFRADEHGEVTDWRDVAGGRGRTREQAIAELAWLMDEQAGAREQEQERGEE